MTNDSTEDAALGTLNNATERLRVAREAHRAARNSANAAIRDYNEATDVFRPGGFDAQRSLAANLRLNKHDAALEATRFAVKPPVQPTKKREPPTSQKGASFAGLLRG